MNYAELLVKATNEMYTILADPEKADDYEAITTALHIGKDALDKLLSEHKFRDSIRKDIIELSRRQSQLSESDKQKYLEDLENFFETEKQVLIRAGMAQPVVEKLGALDLPLLSNRFVDYKIEWRNILPLIEELRVYTAALERQKWLEYRNKLGKDLLLNITYGMAEITLVAVNVPLTALLLSAVSGALGGAMLGETLSVIREKVVEFMKAQAKSSIEQVKEKKRELNSLTEQTHSLERKKEKLSTDFNDLKNEISQLKNQKEGWQNQTRELSREIEGLEKKKQSLVEERDDLQEEIERFREQNTQLSRELVDLLQIALEDRERQLEEKERQLAKLEQEKQRSRAY